MNEPTDAQTGGANEDNPGDLSELNEVLVELERRLESTFEEAGRLAQSHQNVEIPAILDELMGAVYESFRPTIPYDRLGLAFLEDQDTVVRLRWARSDQPEMKVEAGHTVPYLGSSLEMVLGGGSPRVLNDLESYLKEHPDSTSIRLLVAEGMRASFTLPLVLVDRPVGFIFLSSTSPDTYTDAHRDQLTECSERLTRLVEKSRLYEELVDLSWQLGVARDALEYQATHDGLTKLWSRTAILEIAKRELDRSRREGKTIAVMVVDIDRFREINVAYGHQGGDAVLRGVASRLAGSLRSYEEVGRYSGEEFLVTLYSCDRRGAEKVSERLRALVSSAPIATPFGEIPVTITVGATVSPASDSADLDRLIGEAEKALEQAKKEAPGSSMVVEG